MTVNRNNDRLLEGESVTATRRGTAVPVGRPVLFNNADAYEYSRGTVVFATYVWPPLPSNNTDDVSETKFLQASSEMTGHINLPSQLEIVVRLWPQLTRENGYLIPTNFPPLRGRCGHTDEVRAT